MKIQRGEKVTKEQTKEVQYKIEQLQKIIEEGIGSRTKRAFALEVGITPEHLSRMLKKGYKTIPSRKVLSALAKGLPNTSLQELFDIFGIESHERSLTPIEACSIIMQDFKETFARVTNIGRLFNSVEEFLSDIRNYSLYEMVRFEKVESKPADNGYEILEVWKLTYQDKEIELNYYVMLSLYKVAVGGKLIVGQAYYKLDEMRSEGFKLYATIGDPYTCSFINVISGEEYDVAKKIKTVKYGFGFYLDDIKDDAVERFIKKYSESNEEELVTSDKNLLATIMKKRTKLNFSFVQGEESCGIILEEDEINDMFDSIVMSYAKELGVKQYGDVHFIVMENLREDKVKNVVE